MKASIGIFAHVWYVRNSERGNAFGQASKASLGAPGRVGEVLVVGSQSLGSANLALSAGGGETVSKLVQHGGKKVDASSVTIRSHHIVSPRYLEDKQSELDLNTA